jgi:hypothetical protein
VVNTDLHRPSYRKTVGCPCARHGTRKQPLICSITEPHHRRPNDYKAEGDWNNLADLKWCQCGGLHLSFRGVRTISITIYALFDAARYVASMVTNDTEYNAPHSMIRMRIG